MPRAPHAFETAPARAVPTTERASRLPFRSAVSTHPRDPIAPCRAGQALVSPPVSGARQFALRSTDALA
jgi:hypothetical protein